MRATLRLVLILAVGVTLSGTARADEDIDAVKRQLKIATDEVVTKIGQGLLAANEEAKTSIKNALEVLEGLNNDLGHAQRKGVAEETINDLKDRVKSRRNFFLQAQTRGDTRYDVTERARILKQQSDDFQKKQSEMRDYSTRIAELYKTGKFTEAQDLNRQRAEKFGRMPADKAIERMASNKKAFEELRGIRDEKSRRHQQLMTQMMKASMPVTDDIEFPSPEKWKTLSKRANQVKLTEEETKLLKALQTVIKEDLKQQPLSGVLDAISTRHGVKFSIDRAALNVLQITDDTLVNFKATNTTLRTALKSMLAESGLTYIIRKGELHITTPDRAAAQMVIRTYYLGDLLTTFNQTFDPFGQNQLAALQTLQSIIEQIQSIEPQSWQTGGGAGTITFNPALLSLVIKQSAEMHYQLQGSLR